MCCTCPIYLKIRDNKLETISSIMLFKSSKSVKQNMGYGKMKICGITLFQLHFSQNDNNKYNYDPFLAV